MALYTSRSATKACPRFQFMKLIEGVPRGERSDRHRYRYRHTATTAATDSTVAAAANPLLWINNSIPERRHYILPQQQSQSRLVYSPTITLGAGPGNYECGRNCLTHLHHSVAMTS
ncbi:hypothetical protein E2C01_028077 [Portunus trituberculatus]|uniref:Uncharacterized protein n=1 Tax=Portunus trituberculatus TaxID=210409 RepID=A0A5B7END6_PORTR|nr:hypothetical protein [Portunus trituberculatus]